MKTADLAGPDLDNWVAKALGTRPTFETQLQFMPSTDWAQAGPIIEREGIHMAPMPAKGATWCATAVGRLQDRANATPGPWVEGPTPLIAAMRAFQEASDSSENDLSKAEIAQAKRWAKAYDAARSAGSRDLGDVGEAYFEVKPI